MAERTTEHLRFVDELRGVAIALVFLFHLQGQAWPEAPMAPGQLEFSPAKWLALPLTLGWAGVAVFFVISGFCIHLSFVREPHWGGFWFRRFFRIYPPYLVALVAFALVRMPWDRNGALLFGAHASLLHNFHPRTIFSINASFWSIAVEAQLYLLYPLLRWMVARRGWPWVLAGLAAGEVVARVAGAILVQPGSLSPYTWIIGMPFAYWFSWSLGALLAERFVKGEPGPAFLRWPVLWLVLVVTVHFTPVLTRLGFAGFALATAALMCRLMESSRTTLSHLPAISRALTWLGTISYSLYLLHQPLMELSFERVRPWVGGARLGGFGFGLLLAFPLLLLAWLSYRWIERPSIAWGKVLMHRCLGPKMHWRA